MNLYEFAQATEESGIRFYEELRQGDLEPAAKGKPLH